MKLLTAAIEDIRAEERAKQWRVTIALRVSRHEENIQPSMLSFFICQIFKMTGVKVMAWRKAA